MVGVSLRNHKPLEAPSIMFSHLGGEVHFYNGTKEELLPGFEKDFPYIASRAELDRYIECYVPWHWHRTVELFYVESGSVEYDTPKGKILFPAGSGGMVNSNVLHMTKAISKYEKNVQLLHKDI